MNTTYYKRTSGSIYKVDKNGIYLWIKESGEWVTSIAFTIWRGRIKSFEMYGEDPKGLHKITKEEAFLELL